MTQTDEPDPVAETARRLRASGWSVGIVPFRDRDGARAWLVTGHRAGGWIVARGATRAEAWAGATEQATGPAISAEIDPEIETPPGEERGRDPRE